MRDIWVMGEASKLSVPASALHYLYLLLKRLKSSGIKFGNFVDKFDNLWQALFTCVKGLLLGREWRHGETSRQTKLLAVLGPTGLHRHTAAPCQILAFLFSFHLTSFDFLLFGSADLFSFLPISIYRWTHHSLLIRSSQEANVLHVQIFCLH